MAVTIPTPTKNAVPSADIKDVVFAGAKIDEWATSDDHYYIDRLGVKRITASGIEYIFKNIADSGRQQVTDAILSSGIYVDGSYEDGIITISSYNQAISYNGNFYRLKPSVKLPFTTSGTTSETWSESDSSKFTLIGSRESLSQFDSLRTTNPLSEGELIYVDSHQSGTGIGGGLYKAISGNFADDGGYTAKVNDSWAWQLTTPLDEIKGVNFGVVPNEIISGYDSTSAIQNYGIFIASLGSPRFGLPLVMPEGTINIVNVDLSSTSTSYPFRLKGAGEYEHGRQTATIINLTGSDGTYGITVNSHIVELVNIGVVGGYNAAVNTRKFITSKTRPTWLRVSKFYAGYMGGVTLDFLDTLDTKCDQFYTEYTYDSFLKVLPSETSAGGWTISTAIELSNFNIQYHTGGSSAKPAILVPLSYYGVINNGWIEHTDYPANLAYGMWNINSLAIESTTYPVYAYLARIKDVWGDYKLGTPIDYTLGASEVAALNLTIPSWVSDARFANAGIIEQPSYVLNKGASATHLIMPESRISNGNGWYYLGLFTPQYTAHGMIIEIQGANGYNADSSSKVTAAGSGSGTGKCRIRIQNKGSTSTPAVSWSNENSSGILAVKWKYVNSSNKQIAIYVQIAQYSNSMGVFVYSDSDTPTYQNGVVSYYTFSGAAVSDISTVSSLLDASSFHAFHNNKYGFGMNLDLGIPLFDTPTSFSEGSSGQTRCLPVYNNGQRYNIPLSADGLRMPVYTKATMPTASGTNYYSFIVVTNGSASGTATVAWSNGSNWLRVSDNVVITS